MILFVEVCCLPAHNAVLPSESYLKYAALSLYSEDGGSRFL